MREALIKEFWEGYVKKTFQTKPDIMRFLLKHERRALAEKNLRLQVFNAELKFRTKMDKAKLQRLVEAGATIFCDLALKEIHTRHMTAAEKRVQEAKAGREKEVAEWYAEENRDALSTATKMSMFNPQPKP